MTIKSKQFSVLDVGVTFGTVSLQKTTARIALKIDRGAISLSDCDELFCDRRLTGKIVLSGSGDAPGQKKLVDDLEHEVGGVFDVKGFSAKSETISFSLTFGLKDVDVNELAHMSSGQGRLQIKDNEPIPEDEKDEDDPEDHVPGSLKAEGPWKKEPLDKLFDPKKSIRKNLAAAGINTVGQLADYSAADKRLTDITGVGAVAAQTIEDTLLDFWADNPEAESEVLEEA